MSAQIQLSHDRRITMKWLLLAIFVLSLGVVFALSDTENATAYGLHNLTTSSPISPVPTPATIKLNSVDPKQGVNTSVAYVNLYGENLRNEGQLYLRYAAEQSAAELDTQRTLIPIRAQFVSPTKLVARIPAKVDGYPLKPGYYDFVLTAGSQQATLVKAYRVLDPEDVNDLYAEPYYLSSVPGQLWSGEATQLALKVQRMGGHGGTGPFYVDFYLDSISAETWIGRATVPGISPNGSAYSSMVTWTPQTPGRVKIISVIDPDSLIAETDEENNVIVTERRVSLAQVDDTYPPVISNLQANGGMNEVHEQQVNLSATLEDGVDPENPGAYVSGPSRIYYVELHWYSGVGGNGNWIPVNWTEWLPYDTAPDAFTLHPTPGLRYLQAWGADAAGNISNLPDGRRLNYIPNEDEVAAGEIRVYREDVAAGQCLNVTVTPTDSSMDTDLYIWAPDGSLAGYSLNGSGLPDEVIIQPTNAGAYQIEIEGFTAARYHITISAQDSCGVGVQTDENTDKAPRSTPAIPVDNAPQINEAPLPQEEFGLSFIFLTMLTSNIDAVEPEAAEKIYLPVLLAQ